jgi:Spx/MgsR family transcriptional regulator
MIDLYGIPNCDTVKKARTSLDAAGYDVRFHDFKKEPPTLALLERWADAVGWEALLNRRGTTFRGLPEADKADIDRARALRLMQAHPSLIKRPVIERVGVVTVGWTDSVRAIFGG